MKVVINDKELKVKVCNKFINRLLGMMFRKNKDYCFYFPKCNSIHTFFMFQNIDVIMTDKNDNIVYYKKNLKPWRIILPIKNAYNTLELPSNKISDIEKIKEIKF